jgi:GNAT superfamily N-acetyltransferase
MRRRGPEGMFGRVTTRVPLVAQVDLASGARVRRGQAVMRAIERCHPKEPHYLAVLGTNPAHQGEGIGSALVRHVLDDPANVREPAYLETETPANVPFYERTGFESSASSTCPAVVLTFG